MIDTWKGLSCKARQGNLGSGQDPVLAEAPGQGETCDTGTQLTLSSLCAEATEWTSRVENRFGL